VELEYREMRLSADEMDYSEQTQEVEARGNVHFQRPVHNEDLHAKHGTYNLDTGLGKFYEVSGTTGARVTGKNILLTTTNPFFFEARQVDKVEDNTYILHHAWVTSCKLPNPLWTFHAATARVRPDQNVLIRNSWFRFHKVPVIFSPVFYHSLEKIPRSTGFLTPHIGTSSRKGTVVGESFFWAINRSADALIGAEYYSSRGWAPHATLRLRPHQFTYLDVSYFEVIDSGLAQSGGRRGPDQGGRTVTVLGASELPRGFRAVANINYLSSYQFRLAFTESYSEAIGTEVHSVAFLSNHFKSYDFHTFFRRNQNFQSPVRGDSIEIRTLPGVHFSGADRRLFKELPLYFSFDTASEAVSRSEPGLDTAHFVSRFDIFPRVTLPLYWKDFHITPSFGFRTTSYGSRLQTVPQRVAVGQNLTRVTEEFDLDFRPPALQKVFRSPWKALGDRWKHVIEPRATFTYVNGVHDFQQILRFDERDILVNTREVEYSLVQRLYSKREASDSRPDSVRELASWELTQRYYFDPTFGGALVPGQRNVFTSTIGLSGYAFLDGRRRFSPITSLVRVRPVSTVDVELRADYDTVRQRIVDTGLAATVRQNKAFATLGQYLVRSSPLLAEPSNQIRATVGYGGSAQLGPNIVWLTVYDIRNHFLQYSAVQASYNVDCCGITVELRRYALGPTRNENQWRVALSFANVGTFGNIKKRERLF